MRCIEVLRKERLHKENDRIAHLLALYNDTKIDEATKKEILRNINFCKRVIGNLEETVNIVIAKHANLLFNGITESLKYYEFNDLFFSDINKYLNRVASLKCENNMYVSEKESGYNLDIQRAILFFNFTYDEMKMLSKMNRDEFMCFINRKYGTNIPMLSELIDAHYKWYESRDDLQQVINARKLKLLRLRNGAFIQTEYPLIYKRDIIEQYDKLEMDACRKSYCYWEHRIG